MNVSSPVDRFYAQLLSREALEHDSRAELRPTRIRPAEKLAERGVVQDGSDESDDSLASEGRNEPAKTRSALPLAPACPSRWPTDAEGPSRSSSRRWSPRRC